MTTEKRRERGYIFTLGTSTRNPQEFIALLTHYGIEALIDVRRFPTSRFDHFIKENLVTLLEGRGIDYLYLGQELGGYRPGGYEKYMGSEAFKKGVAQLEEIAEAKKVALVCSERLPWKCHRRHIGRALRGQGWQVHHIIDIDRMWTPKAEG